MKVNASWLLLFLILNVCAGSKASEGEGIRSMTEEALAFLATLTEEQQKTALLTFESSERTDWHYFPRDRSGLSWNEMTEDQVKQSWKLMETALSEKGYAKARGVVAAERILWEESQRSDHRDPGKYYVAFFGEPETSGTWGLRLEGHHLSINLTVVEGKDVYLTPSFFGANPDEFEDGSRPLAGEGDQARSLIRLFTPEQLERAAMKEMVREIVTRAKEKVSPLQPDGIPAAEMKEAELKQLRLLIDEYIGRYRKAFADDDWKKIDAAGFEKITFTFGGSIEKGKPFYYRIQGPTFLMEYANVQRGGDHSHTVWRDFENDFGYDTLKDHIEANH
ncbi:MAG: DUF3500 domain-containing protein [Verrucomicrobiota bacterium]